MSFDAKYCLISAANVCVMLLQRSNQAIFSTKNKQHILCFWLFKKVAWILVLIKISMQFFSTVDNIWPDNMKTCWKFAEICDTCWLHCVVHTSYNQCLVCVSLNFMQSIQYSLSVPLTLEWPATWKIPFSVSNRHKRLMLLYVAYNVIHSFLIAAY